MLFFNTKKAADFAYNSKGLLNGQKRDSLTIIISKNLY